ncbi:MAG TPA: hypothetical protein VMW62_15575 [Chloroflexota bacterium]|nr:hypothetical protein [Chloroflexota bacterium]
MAEPADLLVAHADWLVTVDESRRIFRDGAVAIRGDRIVAVGKHAEVAPRFDAQRRIDASHHVVLPGLIDAHIHTASHLSRGLADEVGSQTFLFQRMYPSAAVA